LLTLTDPCSLASVVVAATRRSASSRSSCSCSRSEVVHFALSACWNCFGAACRSWVVRQHPHVAAIPRRVLCDAVMRFCVAWTGLRCCTVLTDSLTPCLFSPVMAHLKASRPKGPLAGEEQGDPRSNCLTLSREGSSSVNPTVFPRAAVTRCCSNQCMRCSEDVRFVCTCSVVRSLIGVVYLSNHLRTTFVGG
jgi:hypothetical protein